MRDLLPLQLYTLLHLIFKFICNSKIFKVDVFEEDHCSVFRGVQVCEKSSLLNCLTSHLTFFNYLQHDHIYKLIFMDQNYSWNWYFFIGPMWFVKTSTLCKKLLFFNLNMLFNFIFKKHGVGTYLKLGFVGQESIRSWCPLGGSFLSFQRVQACDFHMLLERIFNLYKLGWYLQICFHLLGKYLK